jgi:outer membrane protein
MRAILYLSICLLFINVTSQSQPVEKTQIPKDSLTLSFVLQKVIQSHPSVKEAEEALNAADAKIGLAKSGYLPNVNISASYVRIGPTAVFDIPNLGTFQLYPSDNYNATLNYEQTLYDFGKTARGVNYAKESKTLTSQNIDMVKQKLTMACANTYYSLVLLQEAIRIKDVQLKTLKEHLEFIEKRKATGSATKYELLVTKVRVSNSESQKIDLVTMQKIQFSVLNSLMGTPDTTISNVKLDLAIAMPQVAGDSLVKYALNHRIEMAMSKERETVLNLQHLMIKAQNYPVLDVFASGGWKNGYIPDLNVPKANYSVGVGLKVPILNGNRVKNNLLQSQSFINNTALETELTRRSVSTEVIECEANYAATKQKMAQFEMQLSQAEEAFALANTNYQAGTITNLDLLDAETSVSESRLLLLRSRIECTINLYKLNIALGNKMY